MIACGDVKPVLEKILSSEMGRVEKVLDACKPGAYDSLDRDIMMLKCASGGGVRGTAEQSGQIVKFGERERGTGRTGKGAKYRCTILDREGVMRYNQS